MEAKRNAHNVQRNQTSPSESDKLSARKSETESEKDSSGGGVEKYKPRITLPSNQEPTYYIGGGNGNAIIEEIMTDLGWRRLKEKGDESYTMKWCELKNSINYNTFKEGEQLVNHIPNCNLLTNKLGLLNSLQEYDRVCATVKKRGPKLDFIPETFRLDEYREREIWKEIWREDEVWICKPTGRNQGKGIFLVKSREDFVQLCKEADEKNQQSQQGKPARSMNRVIQRYLHRPLLLNNKKFDIRAYMLIASSTPYMILYHKGYIRLSLFEYEDNFDNLAIHLTNQFIQKKDPSYKENKEDTVWDMDKFNTYVNEHYAEEKGIEKDWANNVLPTKMKTIMTYCFHAVKHKFHCKGGYFELYGFDFMIDENMKVWLIEVNVNPCLATNCEVLKDVVPPIVRESIYLAVECFDKNRRNRPLMPLNSLDSFEIIHNGSSERPAKSTRNVSPGRGHQQTEDGRQNRAHSTSPVRRARSLSPSKDGHNQQPTDSRRPFMPSMRPGMKPSPTNAAMANQRQSLAVPGASNTQSTTRTTAQRGSMLSSQPTNRQTGNSQGQPAQRNSSVRATQKSPYYTQQKSGSSGVPTQRMFNFDRSQQALAANTRSNTTVRQEHPTTKVTVQSSTWEAADQAQRKKSPKPTPETSTKSRNSSSPHEGESTSSSKETNLSSENQKETEEAGDTQTTSKESGKENQGEKGQSLKLVTTQTHKSSQALGQKPTNRSPYSQAAGFAKPQSTASSHNGKPVDRHNVRVSNSSHMLAVKIIRDTRGPRLAQTGVSLKMTHSKESPKDNRGS